MPSLKNRKIDDKLLQERLLAFTPEALVHYNNIQQNKQFEIHGVKENDDVIDLAKANYLNVLNNESIKKTSEKVIRKYGVGTCGPRAFYGTTEVHLALEEHIAKFLEMEESIVYSYGFVAISSSIAAYCKRSDIVFTHKDCNAAIQQGLQMAKSKVVYFDHSDPKTFANEVSKIIESEQGQKKVARKFLIVEGVSWLTGQILNLPEFLKIAEENKIRVFLEESYSIGMLGETGRGLLEHYKIDSYRVDMIISTLETAVGSIGGFCAGSHTAIEHQRLSGSGYIFSASLPTYLVQTCIESINFIKENKTSKLTALSAKFHSMLLKCGYDVKSDALLAYKVFNVKENDETLRSQKEKQIYQYCRDNGVYLILKENGLIANLNVVLLDQTERYNKAEKVLTKAITQ